MKKIIALLLALATLLTLFACGQKPKTAADWLSLGEKYLLDLDYDQAIAALDSAIEIEPKDPRTRVLKVIVYILADDPQGAQDTQRQAEDDNVPGFPDLPNDHTPGVFFPPVIEWLKEQDLLDFVRMLLELLKSKWPEVVWDDAVEVAISNNTSTMALTTTDIAATTENPTSTIRLTVNSSKERAESFVLYAEQYAEQKGFAFVQLSEQVVYEFYDNYYSIIELAQVAYDGRIYLDRMTDEQIKVEISSQINRLDLSEHDYQVLFCGICFYNDEYVLGIGASTEVDDREILARGVIG